MVLGGNWYDFYFFSSRRQHTSLTCDWSSDVCSSDLIGCRRASDGLAAESRPDHRVVSSHPDEHSACGHVYVSERRAHPSRRRAPRGTSWQRLHRRKIGRASCRERVIVAGGAEGRIVL